MANTDETRRRPGGRSARVRAAVIAATLDVLRRDGVQSLTVATIASQAGVNATSIYRRWGTRENLIFDAVSSEGADLAEVDTGSLAGDLAAHATAIGDYLSTPAGAALVHALTHADITPELRAEQQRYLAERLRRFREVLDRAVDRGELTRPVDARIVLDTLVAPLQMRVVTGEPIDPDLARQVAQIVAAGIISGAAD